MASPWRPWLYAVALFGSQLAALIAIIGISTCFSKSRSWFATPAGTFSITILSGFTALGTVIYFSHLRSLKDILKLFEFENIRRGFNCFAIAAGFVLGVTGIWLTRIDIPDLAGTYSLTKPFVFEAQSAKILLMILFVVGAIIEEIIMRGFLYRAFRAAYGAILSVLAIVLVATLAHPGVMTASPRIFLLLGVLQVTLCVILEKTDNLWNCIACHVLYNATVASTWLT